MLLISNYRFLRPETLWLGFLYKDIVCVQLCNCSRFQDVSSVHQENTYLGQNDIALSNIERIYQITERKRRLIGQSQKISSKIEALHIVCKVKQYKLHKFPCSIICLRFFFLQNFRVLRFGFKRSEIGKGKHIAEALAKFAFPNQHNLLFSYNFK